MNGYMDEKNDSQEMMVPALVSFSNDLNIILF